MNYTELCYGGYFCKHTASECAGRAEARNVFQETSNVYPRQTPHLIVIYGRLLFYIQERYFV